MRKICSIEGCGDKLLARGWCNKHYKRWSIYGDVNYAVAEKNVSPEDNIARNTVRQGDCLVWTGPHSTSPTGAYGTFSVYGKPYKVHRWAYEQLHGKLEDGLYVDHRCHNKLCCEVTHLRAVTPKQNIENHRGAYKTSKSGFRGVYWHTEGNCWYGQVRHNGRSYRRAFSEHQLDEAVAYTVALRNRLFTHNDKDRT